MSKSTTIRKRKTIEVSAIREKVNKMLLESADENVEGRNALIVFIGSILHESGNYHGFGYIDKAQSMTGSTFGVDMSKPQRNWFENTDRTRVHYY